MFQRSGVTVRALIAAVLMGGAASGVSSAPVQWSTGAGGNGHWYETVDIRVAWDSAKTAAETRTHLGLSGHLVTVTSQSEQDFLVSNFSSPTLENRWMGASQDQNEVWTWVTGETWDFTSFGAGEPNGGTTENYLEFRQANGGWNDDRLDGFSFGYVVEYEAAAQVPEPASIALATLAGLALVATTRRRRSSEPRA